MATKELTFARPEDIDIAVPAAPATLMAIMAAYPLTWARAGNGPYFGGAGHLVGLAAERGTVYPDKGNQAVTSRWPALYIEGERASFGPVDAARARSAAAAFSAGPMLVVDGRVVDIPAAIRAGGYDAYDPTQRKPQRAAGITQEGLIADGTWLAATLYEVAQDMLDAGCIEAMKLDGGGSAGVVASDGGAPRLTMGAAARLLPAALVMRRVERVWDGGPEPVAPPTTSGGDRPLKVCIDPGHGGPDPGAVGPDGTLEKHITLAVSLRLAEYLRRAGVDVVLTRETDTDVYPGLDDAKELAARARVANDAKADCFVSIHANSAADQAANGFEVFHWPNSTKGIPLAQAIADALKVASGIAFRRVAPATYAVMGYVTGPAVLVELGFLSTPTDRALLREPAWLDKCALGIAYGILARA